MLFSESEPDTAKGPAWPLRRRGVEFGWVTETAQTAGDISPSLVAKRVRSAQPVYLPAVGRDIIPNLSNEIAQTESLITAVWESGECGEILSNDVYCQRLAPDFEMLASSYEEDDEQVIETIEFDVYRNDHLIDGVWLKVAWLSFNEDDASLRFRFSFGVANFEDVAGDRLRQSLAAELFARVFPESRLIAANPALNALLANALGLVEPQFVERILYVNAPDGGAQFHQDVERGHLGVIYAQLTGHTAWLALSKDELLTELRSYLAKHPNPELPVDSLAALLDKELTNESLEVLLNQVPEFVKQLADHGFGYILKPGDMLLLPQESTEHCAWHSVFCLGDQAGIGLSFAIRKRD